MKNNNDLNNFSNNSVPVSKWQKFKYFLKTKILNKTVGFSILGIATIAGVSGAVVYKYTKEKFKPVFYNYQSYMDPKIVESIGRKFEYKQFGTIDEFTKAVLTHKTAGGIGNDGQAAKLIINDYTGQSKLRKFSIKDFKTIFGANWDDSKNIADNLKVILTPVVFEHLLSYDQYFKDIPIFENGKPKLKANGEQFYNKDYDNEEDKIHLYNYFIPYFAQDMVLAYNPLKLQKYKDIYTSINHEVPEDEQELISYNKEYSKAVAPYFETLTKELEREINNKLYNVVNNNEIKNDWENQLSNIPMINALQIVRHPYGKDKETDSFQYFEYTDAVRDNMIYGSSYHLDPELKRHVPKPTGDALIHEKTSETNKEIITPIYKDLIDQFLSLFKDGTGFKLTDTNHVRTNGDGLELLNTLIDPHKKTNVGIIYNGDALDAFFSRDNISNSAVPDGAIRFIRPSVNLLLVDGLVIANDTDEEIANEIINTSKDTFFGGLDNNKTNWTVENVTKAFDDASSDNYMLAFKNFGSYINFDYVKYTPAFKLVYDYVLENEFNNPLIPSDDPKYKKINEYEKKYAQHLFEITNKYTIGHKSEDIYEGWHEITYNVKHIAISPVNQKTQTEINTYYQKQTKA